MDALAAAHVENVKATATTIAIVLEVWSVAREQIPGTTRFQVVLQLVMLVKGTIVTAIQVGGKVDGWVTSGFSHLKIFLCAVSFCERAYSK